MDNVAMQILIYDHFYPLLNMAHDHGKNEIPWLGEFMLLSIKMMAIKHSTCQRFYNQSRITNNVIQIYNITSQLIKFLLALNFANYDILNYKSWDVTDLPPLKRISFPGLVKRLENSCLR